ncbi:unnamed protein product [Rhizoctonia solani]|uniref:Uncharacterized protein n=1 Tax=Rhizoctonia solani TaxID=456999 RepID=A0A8H2XUC9_9AGAM|nr:unnamed protein product [Rhizoctonia solani]
MMCACSSRPIDIIVPGVLPLQRMRAPSPSCTSFHARRAAHPQDISGRGENELIHYPSVISLVKTLLLMPAPKICTRVYTPERTFEFKDQLNTWCDRVDIGHIRYSTNATNYRNEHNQLLYQAVPIFPTIVNSSQPGRFQCYYNEHMMTQLVDQNVIGFGTSKKDAEEMAAAGLLTSGCYCFY